MGWLLGVIVLAGLASGQPPVSVEITAPPTAVACSPTELSVTVDNRGHPARTATLALDVDSRGEVFPVWLFDVQLQLPSGEWAQAFDQQVRVPADTRQEYRFRAAFAVGRHTLRVTMIDPNPPGGVVPERLAEATTEIVADGPQVRIQRPLPESVTTADWLDFGVTVRNRDGTPPLALEIRSDTRPDKYRGADGVTVEVATEPGRWRAVELAPDHGWYGTVDLGPLPPGADRSVRMRVRSEDITSMPVSVRLVDDLCVAADDRFSMAVRAAPPVRRDPLALMFLAGLGIGAAVAAGAVLGWRRVRR
jgi:hypothetical protein